MRRVKERKEKDSRKYEWEREGGREGEVIFYKNRGFIMAGYNFERRHIILKKQTGRVRKWLKKTDRKSKQMAKTDRKSKQMAEINRLEE